MDRDSGRAVKILYHHRTLSKDGQDVHIAELTAAMKRLGHEVIFVGPAAAGDPGAGEDTNITATLKRLIPGAVYELLELTYTVIAYRRLREAYLRHKPDVLYERYNLHLLAGVWLHARQGVPFLLEVNAPLVHERSRFGGLALRRLATWAENSAWRAADYVLPVTDQLADFVRRAGVAEDRIRIIPNGINPDRFAIGDDAPARRELGLENKVVLGFTGYMRSWHGLSWVVDMIADLKRDDLHLLLVGDGPARPELEALARERGVSDHLTFLGVIARDRIGHYVSAFDVALQPQAVPYASPLKLFEYMALGRAIVAPDQANIREVLTDGENALLFDPKDAGGFRDAVLKLCEDQALRQSLGAAARQTIEDRDMTWDGNARRVAELADGLVAVRRP